MPVFFENMLNFLPGKTPFGTEKAFQTYSEVPPGRENAFHAYFDVPSGGERLFTHISSFPPEGETLITKSLINYSKNLIPMKTTLIARIDNPPRPDYLIPQNNKGIREKWDMAARLLREAPKNKGTIGQDAATYSVRNTSLGRKRQDTSLLHPEGLYPHRYAVS